VNNKKYNMKVSIYLPFFLVLIILMLVFKKCNNNVITPIPDNKELKADIRSDEADIALLKPLERSADSVRTVIKWKYRTLHDTIPCEIKLVYCDSVIYRDSISIVYKDSILSKYDSLFPKYQRLAKIDSLTIDSLSRSNRKFWKGFKVGLGTGYLLGLITPVK
jgi:hypothetical protein